MSDNKFEKQVRQKMDELKITPSSGTWEKIEAGFRSQRRRRFRIWLPALLLLAVGGGYFAYQALDSQPASLAGPVTGRQTTAAINDVVGGSVSPASAAANDQGQPGVLDKSNKDQVNAETNRKSAVQPPVVEQLAGSNALQKGNRKKDSRFGGESSVPDAKARNTATKKEDNDNGQTIFGEALTEAPPSRQGKLPDQQDNERNKDRSSVGDRGEQALADESVRLPLAQDDTKNDKEGLTGERTGGIKEGESVTAIQQNEKKTGEDKQENENTETASLKGVADAPVENDEKQTPAVAVDKSKRVARNWQWGVAANAGMAFVREGNGLDFGQTMMDDLSMASSSGLMGPSFAPSPPSTVPGPSFAPSTPSEIRPGSAFTIGGMVKRNFSNRISVSATLSYAQYNTHTRVGERIEQNQIVNSGVMGYQNVGSYFLNTKTRDYSNRYHFIDLPLTLHVKLNRSDKTPFYLNAGGYLSRLVSSNSLHFDGSNAVYYRNDDFLNKTQAGAAAGFSMVLFNRGAMPLWIGPSLRYGFSPLLKKDVSVNKRFAMPSIDIKLFFNK